MLFWLHNAGATFKTSTQDTNDIFFLLYLVYNAIKNLKDPLSGNEKVFEQLPKFSLRVIRDK